MKKFIKLFYKKDALFGFKYGIEYYDIEKQKVITKFYGTKIARADVAQQIKQFGTMQKIYVR